MGRGLTEFVVESTGHLTFDLKKISELSDEEFREKYNEEMEDYIKNHGRDARCQKCYDPIKTPSDLVRYFGVNLHSLCFLNLYKEARENLHERDRVYFDRVAQIRQ
jgi:hypothetical protein